jgi:hypothetical protein
VIQGLVRYAVSSNQLPEKATFWMNNLKGVKMNALNERQLQVHVPIVAWLLMITNGLLVVSFLLIMALTLGGPTHLLMGALAFPALMFALTIPGLIAGFGLHAHKPWARMLGVVGAVLDVAGFVYAYTLGNIDLLGVVAGAIFGLYAIFVLAQNTVTAPRHA